jgi:hypothetical protein
MSSGVIVSKGNSPYKVSAGQTDVSDFVVSGGSMSVLSGGVRALGPRAVHRLRRCQLCRRNSHLHFRKSIQYQRTLAVTDGVHSASVLLVGKYSAGNFLSANVGGHVRITDPGAAPPSADIGLLINYIAASFASSGVHGAPLSSRNRTSAGRRSWRTPIRDDARFWRGSANPQSRRFASVRY